MLFIFCLLGPARCIMRSIDCRALHRVRRLLYPCADTCPSLEKWRRTGRTHTALRQLALSQLSIDDASRLEELLEFARLLGVHECIVATNVHAANEDVWHSSLPRNLGQLLL